MLDADFFRRWMMASAASVDREAERLTALDSPIGDADHGSNLRRGLTAVAAALREHGGGLLEQRFLPPAVRERLDRPSRLPWGSR